MGDRVNELVREVIDLVRDEGNKSQALDQTLHLVLAAHLDLERVCEEAIEAVRAAAGRSERDAATHLFEGDTIQLGGACNERLQEGDTRRDVVGLEALEVEGAAGNVLDGRTAQEGGAQRTVVECGEAAGGEAAQRRWGAVGIEDGGGESAGLTRERGGGLWRGCGERCGSGGRRGFGSGEVADGAGTAGGCDRRRRRRMQRAGEVNDLGERTADLRTRTWTVRSGDRGGGGLTSRAMCETGSM